MWPVSRAQREEAAPEAETDMAAVTVEKNVAEGVALLTLDNQPLNLVTREMTRSLDEALQSMAADPEVRVLVVTGGGLRAFCAGSDIKEFPDYIKAGTVIEKKLRYENEVYSKVDDFSKPTVAAINGLAYGGGLELAACCDLIVCAEDARLCLPEVFLGVFPGSGGSTRITKLIGERRAKELMFLGNPIDAGTALSWGLINRIAKPQQAVAEAIDLASELALRPNRALQICKQAIDAALDLPEDEAIRRSLDLSREAFATKDCIEGVRAFFAKEQPKFGHS
jgi:enoyl-CoA hydratase